MALVILLLRRLLKRRKLKLKYLFAFVVLSSTFVVVQPFIDMAFNGAPPVWDEFDLDIDGINGAFPLDPEEPGDGLLVITDNSYHAMERRTYDYGEIWSVGNIHNTSEPHFNGGIWVMTGETEEGWMYWTVDSSGIPQHEGSIVNNDTTMSLIGVNIWMVDSTPYVTSFWEGTPGNWSYLMWEHGTDGPQQRLWYVYSNDLVRPVHGWSSGLNFGHSVDEFNYNQLSMRDGTITPQGGGSSSISNSTWVKAEGHILLTFAYTGYGYIDGVVDQNLFTVGFFAEGGGTRHWTRAFDTGIIENGYLCTFATQYAGPDDAPGEFRLVAARGENIYVGDGEDEQWYTLTDEPLAIFQDGYKGDIWMVFDDGVVSGKLEDSERGQLHVQIISFLIAAVLMAALLWKPKWWLVDLGGLLMGAGVIAIMGISFPILFTLLLLVLLAIYDFISVYKTKHMIALADSVVEAKMPILLVFPMKWSYRYEDETNLMDPKRKRESLFMGLGDVIIPGILILSIATFLSPVGGIRLFGFIYPPVAVAIFALIGMLAGWGSLMFFVIKGKAHAGLPPINSGTILGFIIGYLIVYGTIVFW
ncbi:MAG: presenilin family intramembrane aspartyl protease PSH [Thermoplasmatota archaeon]